MIESIERKSAKYENLSEKFSNQSPDYTKQYCSIYKARLKEMETFLTVVIKQKWGTKYPICKLHKLAQEKYDKCIVIGTLFKDQKLKPSILKQLAEANQLTPQPLITHFTDDSDRLFVEDELQRYELLGSLDGKKLVTGVTIALLGTDIGNGKFQVDDHTFCGFRNQIEFPRIGDDTYLLFLSGLDLINCEKHLPNLELLIKRISGALGDLENISKIVRIIIAGNSIRNVAQKRKPTISMTSRVAVTSDSIEAVRVLDHFLASLCQYVDIDVMPGENDPSNHILPQKQMHFCMFPESAVYNTLNLVPNPYFCSIDGVRIIGSSGQPIRDLLGYSDVNDSLEAMETCLKWDHLAPTAPDTLGCFPYYDRDPFIIEECPHVFFAGNQETFGTRMVKGGSGQQVRLISIPKFSETSEVALLNLKNLDCTTIKFDVCNTINC